MCGADLSKGTEPTPRGFASPKPVPKVLGQPARHFYRQRSLPKPPPVRRPLCLSALNSRSASVPKPCVPTPVLSAMSPASPQLSLDFDEADVLTGKLQQHSYVSFEIGPEHRAKRVSSPALHACTTPRPTSRYRLPPHDPPPRSFDALLPLCPSTCGRGQVRELSQAQLLETRSAPLDDVLLGGRVLKLSSRVTSGAGVGPAGTGTCGSLAVRVHGMGSEQELTFDETAEIGCSKGEHDWRLLSPPPKLGKQR